jgi:hypothetical protein
VQLDERLLSQLQADAGGQRAVILRHKVDSLCRECADYLTVALKAAETSDGEREALRRKILGQKEALDDTRLGLRLIARHAAGATRATFEELLRNDETPVRRRLLVDLDPSSTVSALIPHKIFKFSKDFNPRAVARPIMCWQ